MRCASSADGGPAPRGFSPVSPRDGKGARESRQHHALTAKKSAELGFSPGPRAVSTGTSTSAPAGRSNTSTSTAAAAAAATGTVTTSGGYVVRKKEKHSVTVQEPPKTESEIRRLLHPLESVTLVNDVVRLWVTTDGRLHLRRFGTDKARRRGGGGDGNGSFTSPTEELVSRSHVQLPREADDVGGVIASTTSDDDGNLVAAEIRWGDVARLRVESTAMGELGLGHRRRTQARWNEGLVEGFVVDFAVNPELMAEPEHAMAELKVDIAESGDWFGGGHLMKQHWPLNLGCWEVGPHYPFDNGPNGINTLVSTHWVTSDGLAVVADPDTPYLHVGLNAPHSNGVWDRLVSNRSFGVGIQNATRVILPMMEGERNGDGVLRLQARSKFCKGKGPFKMDHPMIGWEGEGGRLGSVDEGVDADYEPESQWLSMRVGLCALSDVRQAARAALATLPRPSAPPPSDVIRAPIWTTWARYKHDVDQEKVLTFAREIVANQLPGSVMEIDDKWQEGYGELDFDLEKFPDPKAMVDELHDMGFKVTLWVMPFIEENTEAYREGAARGYFVESRATHGPLAVLNGLKPGFFKWWNVPPVVALDVTNPSAVTWFVNRLKSLQDRYGIDGYKFDAGEPCFLPRKFKTHQPLVHPSEYTRGWVNNVAAKFELAEVRTGHQTTGTSLLTRMGDRFSEWGNGNGLGSIIPTLLTSGLLGYPFCLPDMIGGNAYFGRFPDRELLVRWAQANALMPAMQFSIAPWDVSADVAQLCKASLSLREEILDALVDLTDAACDSLEPMCRPLWWLDPHDTETYRIQDQFAIGNDLIVAPVVTRGATTRDVYLTEGHWVDAQDPMGTVYEGKRWCHGLDAPLTKLPCFVRLGAQGVLSR